MRVERIWASLQDNGAGGVQGNKKSVFKGRRQAGLLRDAALNDYRDPQTCLKAVNRQKAQKIISNRPESPTTPCSEHRMACFCSQRAANEILV